MRIPKFLTPRRKYEVNESMRLVQFGRAHFDLLLRKGKMLLDLARSTPDTLVPRLVRLGTYSHSTRLFISREARELILFVQWGRMPHDWELSFVDSMKSMEAQGIPFAEVLRTELPSVIGDAPAGVLIRWIGRRGRSQPKRFVKAVDKMFGKSGKRIIVGLENQLDPKKMLDARKEPEEPFQSVIDAIREADAAKSQPYVQEG